MREATGLIMNGLHMTQQDRENAEARDMCNEGMESESSSSEGRPDRRVSCNWTYVRTSWSVGHGYTSCVMYAAMN